MENSGPGPGKYMMYSDFGNVETKMPRRISQTRLPSAEAMKESKQEAKKWTGARSNSQPTTIQVVPVKESK